MNNKETPVVKIVLDIGGLNKAPVDRGLILGYRGDFPVLTVAYNDALSTIELTTAEARDLRDALAGEQTLEEQATEAFDTLFRVINKMGGGEKAIVAALNEKMNREHRTLIQQWWGAIATVIKEYAANKFFDLRNEDSIKWAQAVSKVESYMRFI